MAKVLITGINGFIGTHLAIKLKKNGHQVLGYDLDSTSHELTTYLQECDYLVHLASSHGKIQYETDILLVKEMVRILEADHIYPTIIHVSSSKINSDPDSLFAKVKKANAQTFADFSRAHNSPLYNYELEHVFGPLAKPNHNSVLATFCDHTFQNQELILNPDTPLLRYVYIDTVVAEFIRIIEGQVIDAKLSVRDVSNQFVIGVPELKEAILSFATDKNPAIVPYFKEKFFHLLYATYLSYCPLDRLLYPVIKRVDDKTGAFTELVKSQSEAQVSLLEIAPLAQRGNHFHLRKYEVFFPLSGKIRIEVRHLKNGKTFTYDLTGKGAERALLIPPGVLHRITNLSKKETASLLILTNEIYNPEDEDTFKNEDVQF